MAEVPNEVLRWPNGQMRFGYNWLDAAPCHAGYRELRHLRLLLMNFPCGTDLLFGSGDLRLVG